MWLVVNGKLLVRGVVKLFCRNRDMPLICPMPECTEKKTIGHLLVDCYLSKSKKKVTKQIDVAQLQ